MWMRVAEVERRRRVRQARQHQVADGRGDPRSNVCALDQSVVRHGSLLGGGSLATSGAAAVELDEKSSSIHAAVGTSPCCRNRRAEWRPADHALELVRVAFQLLLGVAVQELVRVGGQSFGGDRSGCAALSSLALASSPFSPRARPWPGRVLTCFSRSRSVFSCLSCRLSSRSVWIVFHARSASKSSPQGGLGGFWSPCWSGCWPSGAGEPCSSDAGSTGAPPRRSASCAAFCSAVGACSGIISLGI